MNFSSCKAYIWFRGKISSWWYGDRSLCLNFAFAIARIALVRKISIFKHHIYVLVVGLYGVCIVTPLRVGWHQRH